MFVFESLIHLPFEDRGIRWRDEFRNHFEGVVSRLIAGASQDITVILFFLPRFRISTPRPRSQMKKKRKKRRRRNDVLRIVSPTNVEMNVLEINSRLIEISF